ncbi:hypothetical protein [Salinicoccus sp. CNSTN-B1]
MNSLSKNITVSAFKYDGTLHYSWDTQLIEKTENYVLVKGEAGRQLFHQAKNKIFFCPTPSLVALIFYKEKEKL